VAVALRHGAAGDSGGKAATDCPAIDTMAKAAKSVRTMMVSRLSEREPNVRLARAARQIIAA
jgi:hypothetical protein